MSNGNVTCPICGGSTIFTERNQKYICQNDECLTKLVLEKEYIYMDETKKKENEIWLKYRYKRLTQSQWDAIREGERIPEIEHKKQEAKECESCGTKGGFLKGLVNIKGKIYCNICAEIFVDKMTKEIPITTTLNIDGYKIKNYIDIESVEIIIGTGIFSEIGGGIADFLGARSMAFERKLQKAKQTAFKTLKYRAFERGGNAVVGIDIDYTEFSGNRIGLIANGTIVEIEPI